MKKILLIVFISIINLNCFAQKIQTKNIQLSENQIDSIFSDSLLNHLNIDFPIAKIYKYTDKSGTNFIILTEKSTVKKNDKFEQDSLKAFNFRYINGSYFLNWSIIDFVKTERYIEPEDSIGFWTKYLKLEDFNKDGLIEPVIVYGTYGKSYVGEARVKILTFYKGKKRAIRNQNSEYDRFRFTKVDSMFYKLPNEIQKNVKKVITDMHNNSHASFPPNWEKDMLNKKLNFDDKIY
ncbi:MAG: hypothetical protein JXR51_07340 [Bacteroidales bacterium]|nr:hypothetical protein [Bacteroidales bacterium]MBN2756976.1 hypothetical protein [Bacteroidales bacterium]